MFILYAVVVGTIAGWLAGGRIERLGATSVRYGGVALLALAAQLILFAEPVSERIDAELGRYLYVGTTLAVLFVVLANLRLTGIPIVALGAGLNLLAILANGGSMPADPNALAALGQGLPPGFSNSVVVATPALWPLTDIFAMPSWMPLANVFSIGDVLIAVGIAIAIAVAMRGSQPRGAVPAGTVPHRTP